MKETILERRTRLLGPNVPTFYETPVHLVKGEGVWLWDADGRKYLDCYNNVAHVGHCHPHVVKAVSEQAATLNTHTRYLHDGILDYVERLTGKFSHDLSQAVMVCTGSEANDIAMRMAQAVTGKTGFIATDNTYHGNTALVSQISTRKPPIGGYSDAIRLVPSPDTLNPLGGDLATQGAAFAREIQQAIDDLNERGVGFAGMVLCPSFCNEGFPSLHDGFLDEAVKVIRAAGGLIICDEVQPGFGRVGSHWWGHERVGFAPDIVTLGKPMGNGHPVAAVVTRPDVMAAFREAFSYFNTFGGNPVSAAAASAVLDVIEGENLVQNARDVSDYAIAQMDLIDHPYKVNVRGTGLFFGMEYMDHDGNPASVFVVRVVEEMRKRGVLMNAIGRHRNTLKMRPPLVIKKPEIDFALEALSAALKVVPL